MYICCFLFSDVGVLFVLRCLIYGPGIFFDEGCDASVPLDDSNGYKNHTLRGVDKVDFIKEELEKAWPGGTFMC